MSKTVFGAAHAAPLAGYLHFTGGAALTVAWKAYGATDLLQDGDRALAEGDIIVEVEVVNTGAAPIYVLHRDADGEDPGVAPGLLIDEGQLWRVSLNGRDVTKVSVRSPSGGAASGWMNCGLTRP
ncbi:MAG: hypothetical protein KC620_22805 [Myxococcales bacterium]|nr:hypothetical protein [Myxococcales bacterium]